MGRKTLKTLFKVIACSLLLICCYIFLNACRDFASELNRKLDSLGKAPAQNKLLPRLSDTTETDGNKIAQLNPKKDDKLQEHFSSNRDDSKDDVKSLLAEHREADSEIRKVQFNEFLKQLKSIFVSYNEKVDKRDLGNETSGKPTSPTNKPTNKASYRSNRIYLARQAELFLRIMKDSGIKYNTGFFNYTGHNNSSIFYREAIPLHKTKGNVTVFLLHGRKYNSQLWVSLGTLYEVAKSGFRVIAIDLPGYGRSENATEFDPAVERAKLLAFMMYTLAPFAQRFLVSPGSSGIYSVPMVMNMAFMLKGVVFVAPTFTSRYPIYRYREMALETLVIYGRNDTTMIPPSSLDSLEHLKNKRIFLLEDASHHCYIDQPDAFHRLLKRFLFNTGIGKNKTTVSDKRLHKWQ